MAAQEFPHNYKVMASASETGDIDVTADGLSTIKSGPPKAFGGSGEQWSPEDLFVAAAVDCFILTFRAMARMSKVSWVDIKCSADGILDKTSDGLRFTQLHITAELLIPSDGDTTKSEKLMERAKVNCLVTKSLTTETILHATVKLAG